MVEEAKFFLIVLNYTLLNLLIKDCYSSTKEMSNLPEVTELGTSCWSILVSEPAAVPPNAERLPLSPWRETRGEEVRHLHLGQAGWERAALDASQGK